MDACIVRIMKARNRMMYNEIIEESINLIENFKPAVRQIKERIEGLVERNYIERDPNNRKRYIYKP